MRRLLLLSLAAWAIIALAYLGAVYAFG